MAGIQRFNGDSQSKCSRWQIRWLWFFLILNTMMDAFSEWVCRG